MSNTDTHGLSIREVLEGTSSRSANTKDAISREVVVQQLQLIAQAVQDGISNIQKRPREHDESKDEFRKVVEEVRARDGIADDQTGDNLSLEELARSELGYDSDHFLSTGLREEYASRLRAHLKACGKMREELFHLGEHYRRVGGDKTVINACEALRLKLKGIGVPIQAMQEATKSDDNLFVQTMETIWGVHHAIRIFHDSLYHQRHAFYFRKVRDWSDLYQRIHGYRYGVHKRGKARHLVIVREKKEGGEETTKEHYISPWAFLYFLNRSFFDDAEKVMEDVTRELQHFGERSLPTFLADEKERATTRYVNITTIATFFSSVTATTLQTSTSIASSEPLWNIVNFFWFISLVFSVSSGISSLLGMTWRKSSVFDTSNPPQIIELWLDKAPIIFLIIAALTFIVGLNLFAYLSSQVRYVSLSTNALTGAHSVCLLFVVAWFIYRLKHETRLVQWFEGALSRQKKALIEWISPLYKSHRSMHFQRHVCWALGMNRRVLQLNSKINWEIDWSTPTKLAKLIRSVANSLKLRRAGRREGNENHEADVETKGEGEKNSTEGALAEYRQTLQDTFGASSKVNDIMSNVDPWTNGDEWADRNLKPWLNCRLWGYPKLIDHVFSELGRFRSLNIEEQRKKGDARTPTQQNTVTDEKQDAQESQSADDVPAQGGENSAQELDEQRPSLASPQTEHSLQRAMHEQSDPEDTKSQRTEEQSHGTPDLIE